MLNIRVLGKVDEKGTSVRAKRRKGMNIRVRRREKMSTKVRKRGGDISRKFKEDYSFYFQFIL